MKDQLAKLAELKRIELDLKREIHSDVMSRILDYIQEKQNYDEDDFEEIRETSHFEWSVTRDADYVFVKWNDIWQYGGFASGSFRVPISYILKE
jgi:Asp-tRNA(Asn)/Glu-tRNA(Gln) amidotransferase C subunit